MTLNEYQRETQKTFKEHTSLCPTAARLANWGIGLGGEAGEVQELLKHHLYYGADLDRMELAKELGDVIWYLSAIATTCNMRLDDVIKLNASKLNHRYANGGFNVGLNAQRHESEKAFADTMLYQVLEAAIMQKPAPMNVILIGPDGSGKTTIARELANRMGFKYHKCDYRQDDKPNLALKLLNEQIDVIYDRFYWPDEAIYSTVKGIAHPDEYWAQFKPVIDVLEQLNTLIIYVTADLPTLEERSSQWADDYVSTSHLADIKKEYARFMKHVETLRMGTFTLDTTDVKPGTENYEQAIQHCINAIQAGQEIWGNCTLEANHETK